MVPALEAQLARYVATGTLVAISLTSMPTPAKISVSLPRSRREKSDHRYLSPLYTGVPCSSPGPLLAIGCGHLAGISRGRGIPTPYCASACHRSQEMDRADIPPSLGASQIQPHGVLA